MKKITNKKTIIKIAGIILCFIIATISIGIANEIVTGQIKPKTTWLTDTIIANIFSTMSVINYMVCIEETDKLVAEAYVKKARKQIEKENELGA